MITRWPLTEVQTEMNRLQEQISRLLGQKGRQSLANTTNFPALNLWEEADNYVVEAELPGIEMDSIEILVDAGNQLSLVVERQQPKFEQGIWHRRERISGQFQRSVMLPGPVHAENVQAVLKNGVLTIHLPKPAECKPKQIRVRIDQTQS